MGASCAKLAKKDCQKEQKKQKKATHKPRKIESVLERSTSEKEKLSNHDLMMDKFNEIETSIEMEIRVSHFA